jgi:hypothetical protein
MKKWFLMAVLLCGLTQGAMAFTSITKAALCGVKPTAGAGTDVILSDGKDMRGVATGGSIVHPDVPFCTQMYNPTLYAVDGCCVPVSKSVDDGDVRQLTDKIVEITTTWDGNGYGKVDVYRKSGAGIVMSTYVISNPYVTLRIKGDIVAVSLYSSVVQSFTGSVAIVNFY